MSLAAWRAQGRGNCTAGSTNGHHFEDEPATGAGQSLAETLRIHRENWRASDLLEPPSTIDLADRIDVLAELMLKGGDDDG